MAEFDVYLAPVISNGNRSVFVVPDASTPPVDMIPIGQIEYDPDDKSKTLYQPIRDLLYTYGILNMAFVSIITPDLTPAA